MLTKALSNQNNNILKPVSKPKRIFASGLIIMAAFLFLGFSSAKAETIYMNPQTTNVALSSAFSLDVNIDSAVNAYGVNFDLNFDTNLFGYVSRSQGTFLDGGGVTAMLNVATSSTNAGRLIFSIMRIPNTTGISGSGNLATLNFVSLTNNASTTPTFSRNTVCNVGGTCSASITVGTWTAPNIVIGTPDLTAPSVPANLTATTTTSNSVGLSWNASTDNVEVTGYRVYRDSAFIATTTTNSYYDAGLLGDTSYTYNVEAFDGAYNANYSGQSAGYATSTLPTPDTSAPDVPTGLTATTTTQSTIGLDWGDSWDDIAVTGYRVYRDNAGVATTTNSYYTDSGLTALTSYTYSIDAFDAALNYSATTTDYSTSTLATPDTTAPSVPASLTSTTTSTNIIGLSWVASTDAVGVTGYRVYRDSTFIATTTNNYYTNTGLADATSYSFHVDAFDAALNYSATSTTHSTSTQLLAAPTDLTATTTTSTSVGLSWTSTTGASGYRVYRGGSQLATTTNNYYANTGLTASTSYSYHLDAYDSAYNYSATSTTYSTSTPVTPTCSSWTYSDWGTCQSNSTQTRTVSASLPSGCTGGSPVLSQSCTYVAPGGGGSPGGGGGAAIDSNAPVRSLISSETSSPFSGIVAINLTTNENATCRYSSTAGNYYSSMLLFNETGKLAHKTAISGLELNKSYTYYTRCQDASGNVNTDDLSITFSPSTSSASSTAAQLLSLQASTPTQTATSTSTTVYLPLLTGPFGLGTVSEQVKVLHQYLSQDPDVYPEKTISNVYSTVTIKAVQKFQCKYLSICSGSPESNGYGLAGPKTRTKINEIFKTGSTQTIVNTVVTQQLPSLPTSSSGFSKITGPFGLGMKSDQVMLLQQILATDKTIYPEGTATGYYGNLTVAAVQRFQCKYLSICSGSISTNAYGLAGPMTRAKINEIFSSASSNATNGSPTLSEQQLIESLEAQIKALQEQIVILLSKLSLALQSKGVN